MQDSSFNAQIASGPRPSGLVVWTLGLVTTLLASVPAQAGKPQPGKSGASPARISDPAAMVVEPGVEESNLPQRPGPRPTPLEVEPEPIAPTVRSEPIPFNGLQAGTSTADDVTAWGEPKFRRARPGGETLVFELPQFKRVEVALQGNLVDSIVVHFEKSFPPATVVRQLQLSDIRPVPVTDESGTTIGEAYPERGVVLSFVTGSNPPTVAQVLLERIDPVPFVLRAERDFYSLPRSAAADLEAALKVDAELDRAHWLKAELLLAQGRYNDAHRSAETAVKLDPRNPDYHLSLGKVLLARGTPSEAIDEFQRVLSDDQLPVEMKAHAHLQMGNALSRGPKPDFKLALAAHSEAIRTAGPLSRDAAPGVRRNAKQTLADAHLAAARDIAYGGWQKKDTIVPQWLDKAGVLVEDILKQETGDEDLRLVYFQRSLNACLGAPTQFDADELVNKLAQVGERLFKLTEDPWRKQRIEWDLGLAYADAAQIAHARGKHPQSDAYAEKAVRYLEQGGRNRQVSREEEYSLGKLYYRLGARRAIQQRDHAGAARWYEKALPLLERPASEIAEHELGGHGEFLISMAVSYWEIGKREESMRMTIAGADLMQQAVDAGALAATAMSIPYGNLASMHTTLGDQLQAKEFAELAQRSSAAGPPRR